ncbi:hypothetical protein D6D22_00497 [Aureobasidium pullulans]|uniref:Uncharacterized protein n=1 Tax=Aureobasidium pullulans TaxID=5580 RepID=A0A4S8YJR1_AURPU|nr:hypothetical protein D6D22_00497 [Aureobasidium pullulans]
MSDTSGDSESSVEYDGLKPFLFKHKSAHSVAQSMSRDDNDSESDTDSSSEEEGEGDELVGQTAMSKKLGYPYVFGMKSEIHLVKTWLKGLANESIHEQVCITKQHIRHNKRIMDNLGHCLKDAAPMADKVSQFMSASVQKATKKVLAAEGTGSALLKDVLATNSFRSEMLEAIEQEVILNDDFPHAKMGALNTEISKVVNSHLKTVLLTEAKKKSEVRLQKKLDADRMKANEALEKELKEIGLTN